MSGVYIDTGKSSKKKKHDDVVVEQSFAQFYKGAFRLFAQTRSSCSKNLLIWAIGRMDKWNRVTLNKAGRGYFSIDCHIAGGKRYADSTVKNAINELLSIGAMVSMSEDNKRDSVYMVNPHFFWKTKTQRDRYESIKAYINKLKEHEGNQI